MPARILKKVVLPAPLGPSRPKISPCLTSKDKLFKAVKIKVRGNNEQYAVHLRTKYLFFPWQYYESIFMADDKWQTIELPLKNFNKSNFYQPSKISSIDINTIGIVAIGRDFQADVDLSFIELTE